ncbi:large ribosomal subunit protein mL54 isoform X1 [Dendrobates tinctorius]|uniref:large ribosomal subunit protein mL54 isoform X1 n=1 Tax=Dendrobates tinctorius TaxID=92724 RepID=UPI003CC92C64
MLGFLQIAMACGRDCLHAGATCAQCWLLLLVSAVLKGKGKGFVKEVQKGPEVCKDPAILMTHAMGVNIYKSGSDVKLKDDSQYPEWLFQLDLGPPKSLEERSPDTPQYWKLLRKLHMWRNNRLAKTKKF